MVAGLIDLRKLELDCRSLGYHLDFEERDLHALDAAQAPRGDDHLLDEVVFDAVDGLEAQQVFVLVDGELIGSLVAEEDEVSARQAVGGGVFRRVRLALGRDRPLGLASILPRGLVLFVGSHRSTSDLTVAFEMRLFGRLAGVLAFFPLFLSENKVVTCVNGVSLNLSLEADIAGE
jgi:hypothetical protein